MRFQRMLPVLVLLAAGAGCGASAEEVARDRLGVVMAPVVLDDGSWDEAASDGSVDWDAVRALCGEQAEIAFRAAKQLRAETWPDQALDEANDLYAALGMYGVWLSGCAETELGDGLGEMLAETADAVPVTEHAALEAALGG